MAKPLTFVCAACGATHPRWSGRCDACGAWNTIQEEAPLSAGPAQKSLGGGKGRALALMDLGTEEAPPPRTRSGLDELDRVLGGGLVAATAIHVGGATRIGKNTLQRQAKAQLARAGLNTV